MVNENNISEDIEIVDSKYSGGLVNDFLGGIVVEEVTTANEINLKNKQKDIKKVRDTLTHLTEMIYKQQDQIEFQEYMAKERILKKEVMHQAKGFFIPTFEYNEVIFGNYLNDKTLGLKNDSNYPVFAGRFIYPVLGFNNEVLGYIGYDKFHDTKYLLSKTVGFGKSNMFYGMHLMRWIYMQGYIVVVEGIVDCLFLWTLGIPAISLNGNTLTEFVKRILKRFGYNVIFIPDNDETGIRAINYWKKEIPEASVIKVTTGKDLDEWRKHNDINTFLKTIEDIKSSMIIRMPKEITI